jgi:hypothetical protein
MIKILLIILALFIMGSGRADDAGSAGEAGQQRRHEVLAKLPSRLGSLWRKYGEWDYKQSNSAYEPATKFNFGATGSAAGLSQQDLMALRRVALPTLDDVTMMKRLDLAHVFKRNRKQLEGLRDMAVEDAHLARIAADYTSLMEGSMWPTNRQKISDQRWSRYKEAFKSVGLQEGLVRGTNSPGVITFIFHAEGLCVAGSSCGFVFSKKKLEPLTNDPATTLNDLVRNRQSSIVTVYERLDANWYSFYELDW